MDVGREGRRGGRGIEGNCLEEEKRDGRRRKGGIRF